LGLGLLGVCWFSRAGLVWGFYLWLVAISSNVCLAVAVALQVIRLSFKFALLKNGGAVRVGANFARTPHLTK